MYSPLGSVSSVINKAAAAVSAIAKGYNAATGTKLDPKTGKIVSADETLPTLSVNASRISPWLIAGGVGLAGLLVYRLLKKR